MTTPSLDKLWGSTITAVDFLLENAQVVFYVTVMESGAPIDHRLKFLTVSSLQIERENPTTPWDYTELTGVEYRKTRGGNFAVTVELWSGTGVVEIKCEGIELSQD